MFSDMKNTDMIATLKTELNKAFKAQPYLLESYLDKLPIFHYCQLEVAWEDYGTGEDSLLSFAEKIRLGKI